MGRSVCAIRTVKAKYNVPRGPGFIRAFRGIDRSLSPRLRYLRRRAQDEIFKHHKSTRLQTGDKVLPSIRTAVGIVSANDVRRK